jgi:hypothetical protein
LNEFVDVAIIVAVPKSLMMRSGKPFESKHGRLSFLIRLPFSDFDESLN